MKKLRNLIAALFALYGPMAFAEDHDHQNRATVQYGLTLCHDSKCSTCGTFKYNTDGTVYYSASYCEDTFKYQEAKAIEAAEDLQIRAKYGDGQ